jgi:hypothetical protein
MCWHQWWQWFYKEIVFNLIVIGKIFYNINLCNIDDVLKLYIPSSKHMNKQTTMPSILHIGFFKEFVWKISSNWGGGVKLHNVIMIKYLSIILCLFNYFHCV